MDYLKLTKHSAVEDAVNEFVCKANTSELLKLEKKGNEFHLLSGKMPERPPLETCFDMIVQIISEITGTPVAEIITKGRKRVKCDARKIAMTFILENFPGYSLKYIGDKFGMRNHSTVIHNKNSYEDLYQMNSSFRHQADQCMHQLFEKIRL